MLFYYILSNKLMHLVFIYSKGLLYSCVESLKVTNDVLDSGKRNPVGRL